LQERAAPQQWFAVLATPAYGLDRASTSAQRRPLAYLAASVTATHSSSNRSADDRHPVIVVRAG
jgi:hypothetical protein